MQIITIDNKIINTYPELLANAAFTGFYYTDLETYKECFILLTNIISIKS